MPRPEEGSTEWHEMTQRVAETMQTLTIAVLAKTYKQSSAHILVLDGPTGELFGTRISLDPPDAGDVSTPHFSSVTRDFTALQIAEWIAVRYSSDMLLVCNSTARESLEERFGPQKDDSFQLNFQGCRLQVFSPKSLAVVSQA